MPENSVYHTPVLLHDCVTGLNIIPDGIYVDATFGGGGHSKAIVEKLKTGKLFAFDQDADAHRNAFLDERFELIKNNFAFLQAELNKRGVQKVNGLLADLGVSSHQFNTPERGFSFRFDAPLDMRMSSKMTKTAADVVNEYDEADLSRLFYVYGELKKSRQVAAAIVKARNESAITTINELMVVVDRFGDKKQKSKFLAPLFQALRIEVNDELGVLKKMLEQANALLVPGGRLVVMSYHSLEDRVVKNFMRTGNFEGEVKKDFYGNVLAPLKPITKKPIEPNAEEIQINSRSRSAKLRIAEKNAIPINE
jgi:16S rRNA (cytosine1402-N4)-methyltransferase